MSELQSSFILSTSANSKRILSLDIRNSKIFEVNNHITILITQYDQSKEYFYSEGDVDICFIGDIFNKLELISILQVFDNDAVNYSNVKLLYELYKHFGNNATFLIDGHFSVLIFTKETNQILSNSSPTFPIYYYNENQDFWVSNEVKLFRKIYGINLLLKSRENINPKLYYPRDFTIFHYVKKLSIDSILEFEIIGDEVFTKVHHNYEFQKNKNISISMESLVDNLDYVFSNIISNYCHSKENIAIALSGGIDSSIVAAYAKNLFRKANIYSFTLGSENKNEFYYSDLCANYLNIEPHKILVDQEMFMEGMLKVIFYNEIYDSYFVEVHATMPFLYEKAAKYSQVLLTGFNADNLFGGNISSSVPLQEVNKILDKKNERTYWTGEYNVYLASFYGIKPMNLYLNPRLVSFLRNLDSRKKIFNDQSKYPLKLMSENQSLLPKENIWRKKLNLEKGTGNDLLFSSFLKLDNDLSYNAKTSFVYKIFKEIFEEKKEYTDINLRRIRTDTLGY